MKNYYYSLVLLVIFMLSSLIMIAPLLTSNELNTSNNVANSSSSPKHLNLLANSQPAKKTSSVQKVTSEDQNVDSFDVNPKSGRWNVTDSAKSSSIDQQSNLQISNYGNSSAQNYTANRDLLKTDSNIQYRSSTPSVSGNTSEYFRDVLGTPMTFDSSTQGWSAFSGTSTVSNVNGQLQAVLTSTGTGVIYTTPNYVSKNVYTNISFDIYCSVSGQTIRTTTVYISGSNTLGASYYDFSCPTTKTNVNLLLSTFTSSITKETQTFNTLYIRVINGVASSTLYLDNIALKGSFNYPTMNLGTNWGFDQSKEYFYDQLGNISNFEDGSLEQINTTLPTIYHLNNPLCTTSSDASWNITDSTLNTACKNSYHIESYVSEQYALQLGGSLGSVAYINQYIPSAEKIYTFDFSYFNEGGNFTAAIYYTDGTSTNETFYLTTDFSWSFGSIIVNPSKTVLYVQIGKPSTVSGVFLDDINVNTNFIISASNSQNQYAKISQYSESSTKNIVISGSNGLSITSSTYKYFVIDFNTSTTISNITLETLAGLQICTSIAGWSSGWHAFSCTAGSNWSGTETSFFISFITSSASATLFINFIGIYDSPLGNTENWVPNIYASTQDYIYVDPQGYLTIKDVDTTTSNIGISYNPAVTPDSTIYTYFTIRIKASDSNVQFSLRNLAGGISYTSSNTLSTSFQTFTFVLNSNWGTSNFAFINFLHVGGQFNGETISIDYILLTATNQQQQPFQIGFLNPQTYQTTFNLTQVYFNASYFRWEAYLYDQYGNIAAYYYSPNQTVSDSTVYYRGKITYQILQSYLKIEVDTDGGTRIFQATYPDDFNINNQINTLFDTANPPALYFASSTPIYSFDQIFLDMITAPYQTAQWAHTTTESDANWITDSYYSSVVHSGVNALSAWQLDTQLLDAFSGDLYVINSNATISHEVLNINQFIMYEVDKTTGTKHQIFLLGISTYYNPSTPSCDKEFYIEDHTGTNVYSASSSSCTVMTQDAMMLFSISLQDLRSYVQINVRTLENANNTASYTDTSFGANLSSLFSDYSNEFVLETSNNMYWVAGDTGSITVRLDNFQFTTKDIFQDIVNAVNNVGSTISSGFSGFFASLLDGFRKLVLWLGSIITSTIGVALVALGVYIVSGLTPLFSTVSNWLSQIKTVLDNLASSIASALNPILQGIENAVGNVASDIISALESNIQTLINDIISAADTAVNAIYVWGQDLIALVWSGIVWFWTNVVSPLLNDALTFFGNLWNTAVGLAQDVILWFWNWGLNFFNILALANELNALFIFLVAIFIIVVGVITALNMFGWGILFSGDQSEIWSEQIDFWFTNVNPLDGSVISVYVPEIVLWFVLLTILGYASSILGPLHF